MGAYDNPGIIRDRSAEIYSKAIASFSEGIAKGIETYAANKKLAAEKAEKTRQGNQNIWLNTELTQNKLHQENLDKYAETNKNEGLFTTFQDQAGKLLNGEKDEDGEYIEGGNIGAKQARYRLKTEKNLTNKDKQEYLDIINRYDTFMGNAKDTIGSITAEGIEFDEYNRSELDRKFTFKGTGIEKTRNMFSYFALSSKGAPEGVTYDTDVYAGPKGENMIKAEITFDPSSPSFLELSAIDQEKIKENGYKLTFDQDWSKWQEDGFLTPIQQGLSEEVLNESIGYKDDKGNLTKDMITSEYISKTATTSGGKTETTQKNEQILNTPYLNSKAHILMSAKAKTILDLTPEEQNDYMAFTLEIEGGDFDRNTTKIPGTDLTFNELLKNDKNAIEVLTKLGQEQYNKDNFGGEYQKVKATEEQATRLNDLNHFIGSGLQVKKGDEIYIKQTTKTIQTPTPPKKVETPKGLTVSEINTLQKRILNLKYPTTDEGKIDRSKLGSLLNDKGWTVTVEDYEDGSSEVFIRNSTGKTTSAIEIEEDITTEKLNRILAQTQGVGVEMSNELFGNVPNDASGSGNFDPKTLVADINSTMKEIQANK